MIVIKQDLGGQYRIVNTDKVENPSRLFITPNRRNDRAAASKRAARSRRNKAKRGNA